ncbi:MAG TPA: chorismate mutase [Candidatus Limnocylindrales bacterium]|nr:chorismate mutase [Candidatus Limnocylindrales bacterium]
MKFRGVRGAITADADTPEAILNATSHLLQAIIEANEIDEDDVASVIFTTTVDLTAAYPAKAARDLGWRRIALLGAQEMDVPNSIPRCIRVLIHWNTSKGLDEIVHVYVRGALSLRPDLYPDNKIVMENERAAGDAGDTP